MTTPRNLIAIAGCLLLAGASALAFQTPSDPYTPLWLYDGSWHVTRQNQAKGAPPDRLINQCSQMGRYFACEQTVNGVHGALLIFIPAGKAGHYFTQNVLPEGRATGRGDLEIDRDTWIFTSSWNAGDHTVQYKTTNIVKDRNHIHFEQAESTDHRTWVVKNSGDELRTAGTGSKRAR